MIVGESELGIEIVIYEGAKDLDCLKHLDVSNIKKLYVAMHKPVSLKFLKDFISLKQLTLSGSLKNPAPISDCRTIEYLSIHGSTIDSLDFIAALPLKLLSLEDIKTRIERLVIPNIPTLEDLSLSGVHKVGDLDFLSDFKGLRSLSLSWLKSKRLFDFTKLSELESLYFYRMLHLTDITALATVPALNMLTFIETPKIKMKELTVVSKIKSLQKLNISYINENPNSYKRFIEELGQGDLLSDN